MNQRTGHWLLRLAAGLWGLAATATLAADCPRIVAVGDLHGGVDAFRQILVESGLTDAQRAWVGEDSCLVQLGDLVDRGADSRQLLDQMMALEHARGERVFPLLGNHEAMNIVGDLRYVSPGEFAAFAGEETTEERERGYLAFLDMWGGESSPELRVRFDEQFPPGWFAHRRAFAPEGHYGSWLLELPAVLVLGETLFVHGGLSLDDATRGIQAVNTAVVQQLRDYAALRSRLTEAGVLNPLLSFADAFTIADLWLEARQAEGAPATDPALLQAAGDFLALRQADFVREDGPLWNRDLAGDEAAYASTLEQTLRAAGVSRIVVGHTQPDELRISARFGNRAYLIDTGAGPAYDGRVSALELTSSTIRAIYAGESELLAEIPLSDEQLERLLATGRVLSIEEIGTGITKPKKMELEWEGRKHKAAFKYVHIQKSGELTRFERAPTQFNFSDSYKYERAAYLLDRHLGMNMIPVAVFREIDGQPGAVIDWISHAVNEQQRREQKLKPDDPRLITTQRDLMQAFDALILNTDRNLANQLWTPADWKLHLIDHSRSFNLIKKLPKTFEGQTVSLPRWFYDAVKQLEQQKLEQVLEGLVSGAQIKALLARRDKMMKQIDADIARYGESMVLY